MNKVTVPTQAGDDSDGKIWGIEGMNILFVLAGLLLSIALAMLFYRERAHTPLFCIAFGSVPFVLATIYVFTLRQGRPKSFDTDLLETLAMGDGWTAPVHQPTSPLSHERA